MESYSIYAELFIWICMVWKEIQLLGNFCDILPVIIDACLLCMENTLTHDKRSWSNFFSSFFFFTVGQECLYKSWFLLYVLRAFEPVDQFEPNWSDNRSEWNSFATSSVGKMVSEQRREKKTHSLPLTIEGRNRKWPQLEYYMRSSVQGRDV